MDLVIDDVFLPATLSAPPMTDEEFAAFCAEPNTEPETRTDIDSIAGEGPVEGFVLDLSFVWDPLGS